MNKLLLAVALLALAQVGFACDEACKRANVESAKSIKFASYLNLKYCQSTANDFLLNARRSLQIYRDKQLSTAHRGGAKNIRNFILQRHDWLRECDNYMEQLDMGNVFRQKDTTENIFKAMNNTAEELYKIMMRKKNTTEDLDMVAAPAGLRFDEMFQLIDEHFIELQKRGLI
jgi:hypothetical protein